MDNPPQAISTETEKELEEEDINFEETEKLRQNEKFKIFFDWCDKNGLKKHPALMVPAAFGSLGIQGIGALEKIESNTVIAAIPNKMLISLKKIKKGELSEIFKDRDNSDLFNDKQAGDAEFNIIATYLIYEKLKGEESFFKPYFDIIERSYTMYDWTEEEVAKTECSEIIDEFADYIEEMNETWIEMKMCLSKYPKFFKEEDLKKDIFMWSYELIMTRIFGYSLPCTCLVPFGDLFNHGNHSATHYIVNKQFEEDVSISHEQYKIKKRRINLSILQEDGKPSLIPEDKDFEFRSSRLKFVKKYFQVLPKQMKDQYDWEKVTYLEDDILRDMVYEINSYEISNNKEVNIWDLKFYSTSLTEDNDTEEEQIENRKKEYETLLKSEQKIIKTTQLRSAGKDVELEIPSLEGKTAFEQIVLRSKEKKKNPKESSDESSGYEEGEGEEDDEEEEQEEEEEEEKEGKKNKNKKDKKEQDKKEDGKIENKQEKEEEKEPDEKNEEADDESSNEDSLSDDSEWDWYENDDKNTYFTITSEQPLEIKYFCAMEGGQIDFFFNGMALLSKITYSTASALEQLNLDSFQLPKLSTNIGQFHFLNIQLRIQLLNLLLDQIMMYFSLIPYFIFNQMWIKPESHALSKDIEQQIIFKKYISEEDWKIGFVMNHGIKIKVADLTKEFRLKRGHLCSEFLVYLRIYLSNHYTKVDISKILFTLPRSLDFEIFVFEFAIRILTYMRKQYSTTIEEDEQTLKSQNLPYRFRFAIKLRVDHKKILEEQIEIVESVLIILGSLKEREFNLNEFLANKKEGELIELNEKHTNDLRFRELEGIVVLETQNKKLP